MRDQKGELQYFIGVQLDGSEHVVPLRNRLSERTEQQSAKIFKATAENVNEAVRELPDANMRPEDLWALHSQPVFPRPHRRENTSWAAIKKITGTGEMIGLDRFKPVRPLGCGDTGSKVEEGLMVKELEANNVGQEGEEHVAVSELVEPEISAILEMINPFTGQVSELLESGKSMLKELMTEFEERMILFHKEQMEKWQEEMKQLRLFDSSNEEADAMLPNARCVLQSVPGNA